MPQGVSIRFRNGSVFNLSRLKASTKVTDALIRELHFADDCMLSIQNWICYKWRPSFQTLQKLQALRLISVTKIEVMYHQPAPGTPYMEPSITIENLRLPVSKQFKYLSVLSNDAQIDEDIQDRISKASNAYGRLKERVWKPHRSTTDRR